MTALKDITGKRYGRLVVLKKETSKPVSWKCQCDCGNILITRTTNLTSNDTKSCGCLKRDNCIIRNKKHGHASRKNSSKTYKAWQGMKSRCTHSSRPDFKYYGGRGITFDKTWQSYEQFLYDMGECPDEHELDRIDTEANYTKENCRWVLHKTNSGNRRNARLVTYNNETKCVSEWAECLGINVWTIWDRIKRKLPPERCLAPTKGEK